MLVEVQYIVVHSFLIFLIMTTSTPAVPFGHPGYAYRLLQRTIENQLTTILHGMEDACGRGKFSYPIEAGQRIDIHPENEAALILSGLQVSEGRITWLNAMPDLILDPGEVSALERSVVKRQKRE